MNINILKNIDLSAYNTFKIGGKAKFFVEVNNPEEIIQAVDYAKNNNLKIFVLGGGSNVLISDNGFSGLVIKIKNSNIKAEGVNIICDAGISLMDLVIFSKDNNLNGLEWAAGIPGTVGGAVRGNAGAFGGEIKDSIGEVIILDVDKIPLKVETFTREECKFDYRNSLIKENNNLILISVKLKLEKGNREESEEIIKDIIKKRAEKQPQGPSIGSFFKNPVVTDAGLIEKFEHDCEMKVRADKLPAGWFIDDLGLRGKKIGGVEVSKKHANFIINVGGARAEDVIILSSFLKQKVRDGYGVQLEEEISKIGFDN